MCVGSLSHTSSSTKLHHVRLSGFFLGTRSASAGPKLPPKCTLRLKQRCLSGLSTAGFWKTPKFYKCKRQDASIRIEDLKELDWNRHRPASWLCLSKQVVKIWVVKIWV